jgi:hypothetical protein
MPTFTTGGYYTITILLHEAAFCLQLDRLARHGLLLPDRVRGNNAGVHAASASPL